MPFGTMSTKRTWWFSAKSKSRDKKARCGAGGKCYIFTGVQNGNTFELSVVRSGWRSEKKKHRRFIDMKMDD
jgi:hypothetical protein